MDAGADHGRTAGVTLRRVIADDIPLFFAHQLDPVAQHMVAFNPRDPSDETAFAAHWVKLLEDDAITKMTIVVDGQIAGYLVCFARDGRTEVGYWIVRVHWGKGVATGALAEFLRLVRARPLHAVVARDNAASVRVLTKCGFVVAGEEREFSRARGEEVGALVLVLEG